MQRKLLLFDLDGTLLTSQKRVSQATMDAIRACKARDMHVGYITARSPRKVNAFLSGLPCDCIAYYNGASVYVGDLMIAHHAIPYQTAMDIMRTVQASCPAAKIGAYLESFSYFDGEIRDLETGETKRAGIDALPKQDVERIRIIFGPHEKADVSQCLNAQTQLFTTSDGTSIIVHANANKKQALLRCAEWFHMSAAQVIAFGDDITDLEMLMAAGVGVAMGNAIEPLKQHADAVTDTNDRDGVAQWIQRHLLGAAEELQ